MAATKKTAAKKTTPKPPPRAPTLYDIDDRIAEILEIYMDPRTGEIAEEATVELEELDMKREDKLIGYVHIIKEMELLVEGAETEIKRMKGRAKAIQNRANFLRVRILEAVPEGTEIKKGPRRIWYRRTTATVFTTDEVPKAYCKHTPESWAPQVTLVREDLKAGKQEAVDCAETKRGWSLNLE
ncbi:hypothetical protein LCGC14_1378300 [marine sediment metagenome]|uniref:Uncharacterized protein n=1 Tax=marine sediment metagenome TaxID=412755 RepID=A0A0F9K3T0_9ZZZZ